MRMIVEKNGLCMAFEMKKGEPVLLLHFGIDSSIEVPKEDKKFLYTMQEIQGTGESRLEHFGLGPSGTMPGNRMNYVKHEESKNEYGDVLYIYTKDEVTGLLGKMTYQFFDGIPIVRCINELKNEGTEAIGIEVLTSFVHVGVADEQKEELSVLVPYNAWQQELQWREQPLYQMGYRTMAEGGLSGRRVQIRNIGSWSSGEYLPLGALRNANRGTMEFWQIEHNGSWNWELQERDRKVALVINGPDEVNHQWWKNLKPGETFVSIPVAVGCIKGGVNETFGALTKYRRIIRRRHWDNEKLPVIFNDFMNCLWADPTTEKELPIIKAAAAIGCEYYCVDAGWYTDENWWYKVGEWQPSIKRFPNGLKEVMDYIKAHKMIPGIWLEIEVMGNQCKMSEKVDDSWFFQRHGKRTLDRDRYQLDFRNPEVYAYAKNVVERLVKEYGVGYFKIDYNINTYAGTDFNADSVGDGLLGHNRAYLRWLEEVMGEFPDVVFENCSSGGMRMDYAMLSRYTIQSTSDQSGYLQYASIAANAPSALTPEQAAIWSYPMSDSTREETIFNCVSSCLLRIHQSGHMGVLAEEKKEIVKEQWELYKKIRCDIPKALPFWPLGLAKEGDDWMSLGMQMEKKAMVAVWHIEGENEADIPLLQYKGKELDVEIVFPANDLKCKLEWQKETGVLHICFPEQKMARLFEVKIR